MKSCKLWFIALCVTCVAARADAATLYAASAAGGPGELYILNPATGAMIQDVGPLNDAAGLNHPITGLAFHPTTGVLYASTANSQASTRAKLVTINPATGLVTLIGSFNAGPVNSQGVPTTMADIDFDAAGNLFGVASIGGPNVYSINTSTGQATLLGPNGVAGSTTGGGLAISPGNVYFGTPTASRFGTYNPANGAYTNITDPTKPVGGAYAALAFDGSVLYGLDLGPGPALETHLVTFTTSGAVTDIGASLAALDAIAFQIPEPATFGLFLVGVACVLGLGRHRY
jgi:hypothetical protein